MGGGCSQHCGYPRGGTSLHGETPSLMPRWVPSLESPQLDKLLEDESSIQIHSGGFQISVVHSRPPSAPPSQETSRRPRPGWKGNYSLGALLGDGISAKVFAGEAKSGLASAGVPEQAEVASIWGSCRRVSEVMPRCLRDRHHRRVAIKRFHKRGTKTFQTELAALKHVGVFPHVLRLLESYEGVHGEDVLILEYCDGSTLYDLYVREFANGGLPVRLTIRLIRQLFLALDHLCKCGIEHQDVKPENMMLHDVCVANGQAELKLGDFGWASVTSPGCGNAKNKIPASGAGSLWYAPPELNPPVPGAKRFSCGQAVCGLSDTWSAGVVLYLLLVGHNPFNLALKETSPEATDKMVLQLVAEGNFNTRTKRWKQLDESARQLIANLLQTKPSSRLSASAALRHPFIQGRWSKDGDDAVVQSDIASAELDGEKFWRRLDGFQRLVWLAIARAVAEPEIENSTVVSAMEAAAGKNEQVKSRDQYLHSLARQLATVRALSWIQDGGALPEILRLAFAYLDSDADGLLSAQDLANHVSCSTLGAAGGCGTTDQGSQAAIDVGRKWVSIWESSYGHMTEDGQLAISRQAFQKAISGPRRMCASPFGSTRCGSAEDDEINFDTLKQQQEFHGRL